MAENWLQPCPLPEKPTAYEIWEKDRPTYLRAYNLTREAESHAQEDSTKEGLNHVISARVAGYLLIELYDRREDFKEQPCFSLAKQLVSEHLQPHQGSDDVGFEVGKLHRDSLARMFRTTTPRCPTPSSHPSPPSFDTLEDMTMDCTMAEGKDYKTARRKALARDGYRCLLTGMVDDDYMKQNNQLNEEANKCGAGIVYACHIINESTMQGVDPAEVKGNGAMENKTSHAVTAMSILWCFGQEELARKLLAENGPHHLENILSLNSDLHTHFDRLNLWFERTDEPNRYLVCVAQPCYTTLLRDYLPSDERKRRFVTFSTTDPDQALPNPDLLSLHAACARVAHMSGAAEVFHKLGRGAEDTGVLAFDGSSSHLLDHLLNLNLNAATPEVA